MLTNAVAKYKLDYQASFIQSGDPCHGEKWPIWSGYMTWPDLVSTLVMMGIDTELASMLIDYKLATYNQVVVYISIYPLKLSNCLTVLL